MTTYGPIRIDCKKSESTIYPNPANQMGYLQFESSTQDEKTIIVRNSMGQIIHQESFVSERGINTKIINSNELNTGIYFIDLISENEIQTIKWLIQH